MLINKSHKSFANVSFHIRITWAVEQNILSLSRWTVELTWNICDVIVNYIVFKSKIVIRGCFIEVISIARIIRHLFANHWWNLIKKWWKVVRMFIYISSLIIWFSLRIVMPDLSQWLHPKFSMIKLHSTGMLNSLLLKIL